MQAIHMNQPMPEHNFVAARPAHLLRRLLAAVVTLALLDIGATPRTSAHELQQQGASELHHHYKLVDVGTFGGPSSYFNNLHVTDALGFLTAFYFVAEVSNGPGVLVGFADTAMPDPYAANPLFCYVPECFVAHAYKLHNGMKTDLGVLPGGASSAAFWITPNGLIVGNSQNGELDSAIPGMPDLRAVIWVDGHIRNLGTLGGSWSFAQAANSRGQVTGLALNSTPDAFSMLYQFNWCLPFQICPTSGGQSRAFVWDAEGKMQDIGTLGGPDAFPALINERGQIAGFSYTDSIPQPTNSGLPTLHPFLWEKGKGMKDLGTLGGTGTASVNGLNERGEVVGGSLLEGDLINQPFLWDGERLINLVAPPFLNTADGEADWINEAGEVVGSASVPGGCGTSTPHAFLWSNGLMTDLGTLPDTFGSESNFINSHSQIVGDAWTCDFTSVLATLWENSSIVDLNTLVPPKTPLSLFMALFIDDRGQIGAFGSLANGDLHAALLIPCDEGHPDIEGCDYSLVAPRLADRRPSALQPGYALPRIFRPRPGLRQFIQRLSSETTGIGASPTSKRDAP